LTEDVLPQLLGLRVATRRTIPEDRGTDTASGNDSENVTAVPGLPFLKVPRRPSSSRSRGTRSTSPQPPMNGTTGRHPALPTGVAATVKKLVKQDVRGLLGEVGTWYVSMGLISKRFFGEPSNVTEDPRIDTVVEARFAGHPSIVAASGPNCTSLVWEGQASQTSTHGNARVNLAAALADELRANAGVLKSPLPKVDDLLVTEYLAGAPVVVRLTYVRASDLAYRALLSKIGTGQADGGKRPRGYGWLTEQDVALLPPW